MQMLYNVYVGYVAIMESLNISHRQPKFIVRHALPEIPVYDPEPPGVEIDWDDETRLNLFDQKNRVVSDIVNLIYGYADVLYPHIAHLFNGYEFTSNGDAVINDDNIQRYFKDVLFELLKNTYDSYSQEGKPEEFGFKLHAYIEELDGEFTFVLAIVDEAGGIGNLVNEMVKLNEGLSHGDALIALSNINYDTPTASTKRYLFQGHKKTLGEDSLGLRMIGINANMLNGTFGLYPNESGRGATSYLRIPLQRSTR